METLFSSEHGNPCPSLLLPWCPLSGYRTAHSSLSSWPGLASSTFFWNVSLIHHNLTKCRRSLPAPQRCFSPSDLPRGFTHSSHFAPTAHFVFPAHTHLTRVLWDVIWVLVLLLLSGPVFPEGRAPHPIIPRHSPWHVVDDTHAC